MTIANSALRGCVRKVSWMLRMMRECVGIKPNALSTSGVQWGELLPSPRHFKENLWVRGVSPYPWWLPCFLVGLGTVSPIVWLTNSEEKAMYTQLWTSSWINLQERPLITTHFAIVLPRSHPAPSSMKNMHLYYVICGFIYWCLPKKITELSSCYLLYFSLWEILNIRERRTEGKTNPNPPPIISWNNYQWTAQWFSSLPPYTLVSSLQSCWSIIHIV